MPEMHHADSIFHRALERSADDERTAYLDAACKGDQNLRDRVERLLRAHVNAGVFMRDDDPSVATMDWDAAENLDGSVGSYNLLEQIGEGGFGVVYVAEQTEPVHRQVAVKIIKPGMDTKQVIARFEAEQQALALMDHPGVAKVLDGGATESGRPYFVMELIKGIPITEYCDQCNLTTRERLGLFVQVCEAVQHAHQKGIIHRDIKPTNVMVAMQDGKPVPKVIDFGVAKALNQRLTEDTLQTRFSQMLGTPMYMSPEQAELSPLEADTRTDIYSLGVLLYELLTGTTPFEKDRFNKASFDELRRIIREDEPPTPSHRLSTLEVELAETVAGHRRTDPRTLRQLVRCDLDWIVMKCLEKDRTRRYESAAALAADVQRFLSVEPVSACPPSAGYKLRKYIRRNRVALLTVALVGTSLTCGTLISISQAVRATYAEQRANNLLIAERETRGQLISVEMRQARQGAQANAAIEAALAEAERLQGQAMWTEALSAARRAQSLAAGGSGAVALRRRVQERVADLNMVINLEEIRLVWQSVEQDGYVSHEMTDRLYRTAFQEYGIDVEAFEPADAAARIRARSVPIQLATALDHWAMVRQYLGQDSRRKHLLAIARAADDDKWRNRLRDFVAVSARSETSLAELVESAPLDDLPPSTLVRLAMVLESTGSTDRAVELLGRAQQKHPDDFWINARLAANARQLEPPNYDEALRFATSAVALRPRSPGARIELGIALRHVGALDEAISEYHEAVRLNPESHPAFHNLANALADQKHGAAAIEAYRRAVQLDPMCAGAHRSLGIALRNKGLVDQAIVSIQKAIELHPHNADFHNSLGNAHAAKGDHDAAIEAYGEAIRLDPHLANAHHDLGTALSTKGLWDEAIDSFRRAIELEAKDAGAHYNLGICLRQQRHWDEAIAVFAEAVRLDPGHAKAQYHLAILLSQQGKPEEAIDAYRKAILSQPDHAEARVNLGRLLAREGLLDEAIAQYREAVGYKDAFSPQWELANAYENLGEALRRKEAFSEAADAYKEAVAIRPQAFISHFGLAAALAELEQWDQAAAAYSKALDHFGDEPLSRIGWPGPWMAIGRSDELFTCLQKLRPDDKSLWNYRARYHAFHRRWDGAAADYQQGRQGDGAFEFACVLLLMGDEPAYQRLVQERLSLLTLAENPWWRTHGLARIAALSPNSGVSPQQILGWAEHAVEQQGELDYLLHTLALAHFRAKQFQLAIQRARESYAAPTKLLDNLPVLAAAHLGLGDADAGRKWLDETDRVARETQNLLADPLREEDVDMHIHGFLEFEVMRREAAKLMKAVESEATNHAAKQNRQSN